MVMSGGVERLSRGFLNKVYLEVIEYLSTYCIPSVRNDAK